MHVDFDQKLLFWFYCFHCCRLPFYCLKVDDEKLYSRLFLRHIKEKWTFSARVLFG